jgi:nuclear transport factor 2 (NTF2) superfamily protein
LEFDEHGLIVRREACINDVLIEESPRRIFRPRPDGERDLEIPLR